jgi:hypothetical protein
MNNSMDNSEFFVRCETKDGEIVFLNWVDFPNDGARLVIDEESAAMLNADEFETPMLRNIFDAIVPKEDFLKFRRIQVIKVSDTAVTIVENYSQQEIEEFYIEVTDCE